MKAIAVDPAVRLEKLVRAHQREVWRFLRFLGATAAEADDLTQETFLEVWRKPFEERSERASAAYLRTVAKNRFLMGVRSRGRKPRLTTLDSAEDAWAELAGDDAGDARVDALSKCLEGARPEGRRALDLVYKERKPRDEVAALLDVRPEGLKTLLRRTKVQLKECVERRMRLEEAE